LLNHGLESIGGGGKVEVSLALVGPDKSIQKLQAVLSYKPQNTASTFENEAVKEVAINGSAIFLDFKTPETVLPNVRNVYVIHYKNNTDETMTANTYKMNFFNGKERHNDYFSASKIIL